MEEEAIGRRGGCKMVGKRKVGLTSDLCCGQTGALLANDTSVDINIKTFKSLHCHWTLDPD